MKNKSIYIFILILIVNTFFSFFKIYAAPGGGGKTNLCDVFNCRNDFALLQDFIVIRLLQLFASLIFIGIVIFAIYKLISSVYKIITAEKEDTVKQGIRGVRSVVTGIGIIFIGIIGIGAVIIFFNAQSILTTTPDLPKGLRLDILLELLGLDVINDFNDLFNSLKDLLPKQK